MSATFKYREDDRLVYTLPHGTVFAIRPSKNQFRDTEDKVNWDITTASGVYTKKAGILGKDNALKAADVLFEKSETTNAGVGENFAATVEKFTKKKDFDNIAAGLKTLNNMKAAGFINAETGRMTDRRCKSESHKKTYQTWEDDQAFVEEKMKKPKPVASWEQVDDEPPSLNLDYSTLPVEQVSLGEALVRSRGTDNDTNRHCHVDNAITDNNKETKIMPIFNRKNLGRLLGLSKMTLKTAAIMLVGYTLGFRAHESGVGPDPSTIWDSATNVVTSPTSLEVWTSDWYQTKVGPTGNTDIVEIVNPDGTTSYFDPATGSRSVKIMFARDHRGFFGNLLRREAQTDPGWGSLSNPSTSDFVTPQHAISLPLND